MKAGMCKLVWVSLEKTAPRAKKHKKTKKRFKDLKIFLVGAMRHLKGWDTLVYYNNSQVFT